MDKTKEVLQGAMIELQKKSQKEVEYNRYKQDCRKKSLDWVMQHFNGSDDDAIKSADKYYKWLISIPE